MKLHPIFNPDVFLSLFLFDRTFFLTFWMIWRLDSEF